MPVYGFEGTAPVWNPQASWIAPNAYVIGEVELGDDVGIWYGSVLRGDNDLIRIGALTNIQENCALHTDKGLQLVVGEGCVIGHCALLHGCVVGDNTLVGMKATIMNGARIGANSIIGAGALVTEGVEIPEYSLVLGAPGKVVRQVTPEQAARTTRSARSYAEKWKRFVSGLELLAP